MNWYNLIILLILCIGMSGCNGIDPGQIIDEASELLNTPTPDPSLPPTPTPTPEPTTSDPIFLTVQTNSPLPIGVSIATENYVAGLRDRGSSISIISIKVKNKWNPSKWLSRDYTQLKLSSPNSFYNWNTGSGHGYTTRHSINPDTGYQTNADGTHRGMASLDFKRKGLWTIEITSKCTVNRGTAYIGVTIKNEDESRSTYWWKWYQRSETSKKRTVSIGDARFVPKADKNSSSEPNLQILDRSIQHPKDGISGAN